MVDWCQENIENKSSFIIDLGCGNGHLCLELQSSGFTNLMGVDYSSAAVSLAQQIAKEKQQTSQQDEEHDSIIKYKTLDILDSSQCSALLQEVSIIHYALDKGTYDAISLATAQDYSNNDIISGPTPAEVYVESVHSLLAENEGILLITSCNSMTMNQV
jgi:SAM-dependent methyltransferase